MKKVQRIIELKKLVEKEILSREGVTGIDVGYKYRNGEKTNKLCIRIFVKKKIENMKSGDVLPKEIGGVKTDIIEEEFTVASRNFDPNTRPDYFNYDTIMGGMRVQIFSGDERSFNPGTAGMVVKDKMTNQPLMLTNWHVIAVGGVIYNNSNVHQPEMKYRIDEFGLTDTTGNVIGNVERSKLDSGNVFMDAGCIRLIPGKRPISNQIAKIGEVSGIRELTEFDNDLSVSKKGATTSLTHGFIDGVSSTIKINYAGVGSMNVAGAYRINTDENINGMFADTGDSGSVVVDDENRVVGLLFAANSRNGTALIIPIKNVFDTLDITLPTQTDLNHWNSSIGGTIVTPTNESTIPTEPEFEEGSFADFQQFIKGLGLKHFKAQELWVRGSQNSNPDSNAFSLNAFPPKSLWNNIITPIRVLDQLRSRLDAPIIIVGAYRTNAYNGAIGGANESQHTQFKAIDFWVRDGLAPTDWGMVLSQIRSEGLFRGGIGIYSDHVHLDNRGENIDFINLNV